MDLPTWAEALVLFGFVFLFLAMGMWIAFALATAGMIGSSGPGPTSLAPNGPLGSGSSISSVMTSGMSCEVGLLYSRIDGNL